MTGNVQSLMVLFDFGRHIDFAQGGFHDFEVKTGLGNRNGEVISLVPVSRAAPQ